MSSWGRLSLAVAATLALAGCAGDSAGRAEKDLGPIERVVDEVALTVWPGKVQDTGVRYIRRLNGFFDGKPTAYWFAGFASRITADVFYFCRQGDTACPLNARGEVDPEHIVGAPVFARIPGDEGYSPFWLVWRVHVPPDYEPNEIKSTRGIERAVAAGRVTVERVITDHGGDIGPDETIAHCLMVPDGTILQDNGSEIVGRPGVKSKVVPLRDGWNNQYRVKWFDFTVSEGVFAPDPATESRPLMRSANIFVFHRDCAGGSKSNLCQYATAGLVAVSERGVEQDFTADGDKSDNNNIISGFPRTQNRDPRDVAYSALWKVNVLRVLPDRDNDVELIDTTLDQNKCGPRSTDDIRALEASGVVAPAAPMSEAMAGNSIPGNNGKVFFNCPSQVADE